MPRLLDLLEYLSLPGHEHIWALLDIKLDNPPEDVMRLIAQTLDSHSQSHAQSRPWSSRIVLGIWAAKYLPLCTTYLPSYPIAHIGFSTSYARQFLSVPHVSFNMLQPLLLGPIGAKFIRDVRQDPDRSLFVWTVNDEDMMRWSIRKEVDGVITDEPEKFLRVCREWGTEDGEGQQRRIQVSREGEEHSQEERGRRRDSDEDGGGEEKRLRLTMTKTHDDETMDTTKVDLLNVLYIDSDWTDGRTDV
ncbi:MAG: hypothetical protein Q9160_000916 [Pyrenula sp. 1 TL-2023]